MKIQKTIFIYKDVITNFKIFEEGIYKRIYTDPNGNIFRKHNLTSMLCINNHIGELEDKYNFTVGEFYNVKKFNIFYISFLDDNGNEEYFNCKKVSQNFSTDQSWEDYEMRKTANKYNL